MAKRRNPEEKGNPLIIVGIVAVLGIASYFLFFKKPSEATPEESRQRALAQKRMQAKQQPQGGVAAGITSILNPLAQAGATIYGAHTAAQLQKAQMG